jgi:hypothetical protein
MDKLMNRNIDNYLISNEIYKCINKQPSEIDCDFYFSHKYTDIKNKDIIKWLNKFNLKVLTQIT